MGDYRLQLVRHSRDSYSKVSFAKSSKSSRVCGDYSVTVNLQLEDHCQPIPWNCKTIQSGRQTRNAYTEERFYVKFFFSICVILF